MYVRTLLFSLTEAPTTAQASLGRGLVTWCRRGACDCPWHALCSPAEAWKRLGVYESWFSRARLSLQWFVASWMLMWLTATGSDSMGENKRQFITRMCWISDLSDIKVNMKLIFHIMVILGARKENSPGYAHWVMTCSQSVRSVLCFSVRTSTSTRSRGKRLKAP